MAVKVELADYESIEIVGISEAHTISSIAKPTMKLGTNSVEVFGLCPFFALTDFGRVLAA